MRRLSGTRRPPKMSLAALPLDSLVSFEFNVDKLVNLGVEHSLVGLFDHLTPWERQTADYYPELAANPSPKVIEKAKLSLDLSQVCFAKLDARSRARMLQDVANALRTLGCPSMVVACAQSVHSIAARAPASAVETGAWRSVHTS